MIKEKTHKSFILVAEDDPDDTLLINLVFEGMGAQEVLRFVQDGEELLDYLCRRQRYADPGLSPRPELIILDLNMPRRDGREVLKELKSHVGLKSIPVAVFTTSSDVRDKIFCYDMGVHSFIIKPVSIHEWREIFHTLHKNYIETTCLLAEHTGV